MITRKQLDLLLCVERSVATRGVAPSFEEMRVDLNLKSKSNIHRLVKSLEARGYVRRLPNRARAIEVLRMPGANNFKHSNSIAAVHQHESTAPKATTLPLMGRIAAGTPIEAISSIVDSITVPESMIIGSGKHYALRVVGDSMRGAGILDSDVAVLRSQDTADDGDIVVALIGGESATLKRLHRLHGIIALESANPAYAAQQYKPQDVTIQGKLIGLLRSYGNARS